LIDGLRQLTDDALEYVEQITASELVSVEIVLIDVQETATLHINNKITLQEGSHNPDARILMTKTVFNNILAGKADFGALIGGSKYSEKRPIDLDNQHNQDKPNHEHTIHINDLLLHPQKTKDQETQPELSWGSPWGSSDSSGL